MKPFVVSFIVTLLALCVTAMMLAGCQPTTCFHQGQKVQLISGGPVMTVYNAYLDDTVRADWFDGAGNEHSDLFNTNELHEVRP